MHTHKAVCHGIPSAQYHPPRARPKSSPINKAHTNDHHSSKLHMPQKHADQDVPSDTKSNIASKGHKCARLAITSLHSLLLGGALLIQCRALCHINPHAPSRPPAPPSPLCMGSQTPCSLTQCSQWQHIQLQRGQPQCSPL